MSEIQIKTSVQLLQPEEKTEDIIREIIRINNASFVGVQRASEGIIRSRVLTSDVYISLFRMPTASADRILGFALVTEKAGAPYVFAIAVDPNYRGMSVGGQLLEAIRQTETKRRKPYIELAVKPSNPAQRLYFSAGYRVRAVARGFYGDEGDGLLMRREL